MVFVSPTVLRLTIPQSRITTSGNYTLRVANPLPGGGQTGTRTFAVTPALPSVAEFVGVTTAVLAGSADAFTVRFRDVFGNLAAFPASVVNFTNENGSVAGTIPLAATTNPAIFTAPRTTYTIDGNYRLWIGGIATTTGNASFVVNANNDARVEFSGVTNRLQAGEALPSFTVKYFDVFNNPTDRGVGNVTLRFAPNGTIRQTIPVVRLSEGVYQTQAFVVTTADTYFVQVQGIAQAKSSYTSSTGTVVAGALPTFDVTPLAAVRATLTGVDIDIDAGTTQPNARVRSYDQYGNLTNVPTLTTLSYSNTTDATVRSSTGTLVLTRTGFGLYDVDATKFWFAGNYTFASAEMAQTTGNRAFAVRALVATNVAFQPSTTTIAKGDENAFLTITYRDKFGNATNLATFPADVEYAGMTMTSSGTLSLGVVPTLPGTVRTKLSSLSKLGDYRVQIAGLTLPVVGTQRFEIIGREPVRAVMTGLPETLCNSSAGDIDIYVTSFDVTGEVTENYPNGIRFALTRGGVTISTGRLEYVGIVSPGIARYRLRAPFEPGRYTLSIISPYIAPEDVEGVAVMEVCSPPTALSVVGANISPSVSGSTSCIVAGTSLTGLTVRLLDAAGEPTFGVDAVTATYQGLTAVSTGTLRLIPSGIRGIFVEPAPPTVFTTAGTYRLTISTNGNFALTTVGTFCVQPDVAVSVVPRTAPNTCITAGSAIVPLSFAVQDRFGNVTGGFTNAAGQNNPFVATFTADAPVVSTGTITLVTTATGMLTELAPAQIFTTTGTYRLTVPVYRNGMLIASQPMSFCVQPDVAAIGIVGNITSPILVNGTQTPVLTVRDRWWNLTDYAGTLAYSGAASGAITLARRGLGVYDGATTAFGAAGDYALAAGGLEMRGMTTFSTFQPVLAVSRTTLDFNATVTTALTQNLTVSGTFDLTYQNMPNGAVLTLTAPANFLLSTPDCTTPAQQCLLTVSGAGTVRVTVNFVRTPQTLAGAYSGALTIASSNNLTTTSSVQVRGEAYLCGDAFPDPPKLTFLVLHTDVNGYFSYYRGLSQQNARVARFRGSNDIREYVMESLDLSNLVNRNSGVNLRFSLDPVIYSTSAVVNVNGMSGALTTGIRDNWYYPSRDENDRYAFGGGEIGALGNLIASPISQLSRLRELVQADIVVLIGSVPFTWIDNMGTTRATVSAAGIADLGITDLATSYFLLDINRTFPKSLIFTHEAGHLCGGRHDSRDNSLYTAGSAGAIMSFPANPPVQTATIDFGWYHGGTYRYNEEFVSTGRNLELSNLATPTSVVEVGTIMAQFQPKVMNWSNPAISVTIPESGVFLPTGNTPPGGAVITTPVSITIVPYQERNMAARMNSDNTTAGVGGGRTVANLHQEHITYIDASISGTRTLAAASTSTYRVNVCGALATRPFTYRWLLQQAGTQVFTEVGTQEFYTLTMPNNREVRLRVEVTDRDNRRVTAEAYITCAACSAPVITALLESSNKGSSGLSSSTTDERPFEFPICAGNGTQTILAQTARAGNSSLSSFSANAHPKAQETDFTEEISPVVVLDVPYPNPAQQDCTVGFSLPNAEHIHLALYDAFGRNMQTILDDKYSRGQKTFSVSTSSLPTGVYTLRLLTSSGKILVKNLVIIR